MRDSFRGGPAQFKHETCNNSYDYVKVICLKLFQTRKRKRINFKQKRK